MAWISGSEDGEHFGNDTMKIIEFIVIHPFRDGNGRLARLLATIMALQANKPPLNFDLMIADGERYIKAIHAGHAGNYLPISRIFDEILQSSPD